MTDLNTLTIHGRIVKNADFTTTDSGLTIVRFAVASNKARKLQNGEWVDETTFVPLVLFDKRALGVGPYLKKGRGVTVQGHLKQHRWEKDGEKRTELAVVVDNLLFDPVLRKPEEMQQVKSPEGTPVHPSEEVVKAQEEQNYEVPFMNEGEFYSEPEPDYPPPEVMESFGIY